MKVVAEIGSNWVTDGNDGLWSAKYAISCAKKAGADAVKFQIGLGNLYSSVRAKSLNDRMQKYDMPTWWLGELKDTANRIGIELWASVFDIDDVYDVVSNVSTVKIASPDIVYSDLILECVNAVLLYGKEIAISTGGATNQESLSLIGRLIDYGVQDRATVLHCVSSYPASESDMNLLVGTKYMDSVSVGLSDHTKTSICAQLAVALGYTTVEKHFMPFSNPTSPDACVSLDVDDFAKFVYDIRVAEEICGDGIKRITDEEKNERNNARRGKDGKRPIDGVRL